MKELKDLVGNTDIYLIDQILKGRYAATDRVLDAGCGDGRNLIWFMKNKIPVYGIDHDQIAIARMANQFPAEKARFTAGSLEKMSYADSFFDHLLSSAVLHFAQSEDHFHQLFKEHCRVLKPRGSIFLRMTSDIGLEAQSMVSLGDGVYKIPDGSSRFLLTRKLIKELLDRYNLNLLEPIKTTNVNDIRCMTTLMLQKNSH